MKTCKESTDGGLVVFGLGLGLCVILAILVGAFFSYQSKRSQSAFDHIGKLDLQLTRVDAQDLLQLQSAMVGWKMDYLKLDKKDSHKDVLKQVGAIQAKARSLKDRISTLSAEQYLRELNQIRSAMKAMPKIGMETFAENNPWISGFVAEVVWGAVALMALALLLLLLGVFVAVVAGQQPATGSTFTLYHPKIPPQALPPPDVLSDMVRRGIFPPN